MAHHCCECHHHHHHHKKTYAKPIEHKIPWPVFWGAVEVCMIPERIIRSDRATIFFWADGTKTVVKKHPEDAENFTQAYVYAIGKKIFGNSTHGLKEQVKNIEEMVEMPLPECLK